MRLEYIDKYKYWEIDWWMICDPGWLDQDKVVMTHNRSIVDNLVPTKIEETLAKFSTKKNSIILDIIQYLTFVKKYLRFHDIIIWGCYIKSLLLKHTSL
jgi:hypothetical protein